MFNKFVFLALLLSVIESSASFGPQQSRLGLTAGQVFLTSDVLDRSGNAIGFGLNFAYQVNSLWAMEAQHLRSSHDNLKHRETSVGANYYFSDDPIFITHANFGFNFVSHELKVAGLPAAFNENGFGVYAGIGVDFLVSDSIAAGLQVRYNKMFGVDATDGWSTPNRQIPVIQDFATLLVRISYIFE